MGDQEPQRPERLDRRANSRWVMLAFCLLLADVDPPQFDRAIARWHARFVLEATGITADEPALVLFASISPR
jgi:hypothetical protein